MPWPEAALEDAQCAASSRARGLKLSPPPLHEAKIGKRDRDLGMLGPVRGLQDRKGVLLRRARRLKISELRLHVP